MAGFKLTSRQVTISQTNVAQPIASGSQQAWVQNFIVKAKPTNSGSVYIGDSTIGSSGFSLPPGASLESSDLSEGTAREMLSLTQTFIYGTANDIIEILHEKRI